MGHTVWLTLQLLLLANAKLARVASHASALAWYLDRMGFTAFRTLLMKVVSVGAGDERLSRWAASASEVSRCSRVVKSASRTGTAMADVVAERKRAVKARRDE